LQFTLLVNSCDAFADCWLPFFTLLGRYWPQVEQPILLNTETINWQHDNLSIRCSKVQRPGAMRPTWSECLLSALTQVDTDLVLYMQEDYFLARPVNLDKVARSVALMLQRPEVGHIALSRHCSQGPYAPFDEPGFGVIGTRAGYRISTQAGLWRVDTLRSYLRPEENGWMFEIFGTWRAWRRRDLFLAANYWDADGPAFEYLHTGIIKGRWHPGIQELFAAHSIDVDFRNRGFYVEKPALMRRAETARALLSNPAALWRALRSE
jgi:hypothetical protein